jgi:murein DD-endopeptidase MepM/ murein hydrolase activator NlpD
VINARTWSMLWMVSLLTGATIAFAGILSFMMRVQRDPLWDATSRTTSSMPRATVGKSTNREPAAAVPAPPPPVAPPVVTSEAPPIAAGSAAEAVVEQLRVRRLQVPVSGIEAGALVPSFAQARGTRVHEALDIMAAAGTPVVAVEGGTIAKLFTSQAGGLTIYQFDPSGTVAYYYAHLQGYAPDLVEGETIARGEVLGYVGSTGNASPSAPHLHFGIFLLGPERRWWQGTAIDPYLVLKP